MTDSTEFRAVRSFSAMVHHDEGECDLPQFAFPGAVADAWMPGISVRVSPSSSGEWVGHFSRRMESVKGIDLCCSHPDGDRVVVVSRGTGYIVSAHDPSQWEEIEIYPILGHLFDADSNTLVLFDFIRATGIRKSGGWRTRALSWDGIMAVEAKDGVLTGQGWDAAESEFVPFEVNLLDGTHSGGASSPNSSE